MNHPATDPLILDLSGDGVSAAGLGYTSPYFDIDGDGVREQTAWISGSDGFLVRDLNANGTIDGIAEMFGSADAAGFAQLGLLDTNTDGKIDALDAGFSGLRVWVDANGNAITDAGELKTLAELNIAAINLATTDPFDTTDPADDEINGNQVVAYGTFTRTDNTTGVAADVNLVYRDGSNADPGNPDNNPNDPNPPPQDPNDPQTREFSSLADGGEGEDTADYSTFQEAVTFTPFELNPMAFGEGADQIAASRANFVRAQTAYVRHQLVNFENIIGSAQADTAVVNAPPPGINQDTLIDGGTAPAAAAQDATLGDTLSFADATTGAFVGRSTNGSGAEVFGGFEAGTSTGFWMLGMLIPTSTEEPGGMTDPTGTRFTNFEYVVGSDYADMLGLVDLNPGSRQPDASQMAARSNAITVSATLGAAPAVIGAVYQEAIAAVQAVGLDGATLRVEAGAGDDSVVGSNYGYNQIYGGAGIDYLYAGGFVSEVDGGDGSDYVSGGGLGSFLTGGDGADIYNLAANAVVTDATTEDFIMWGQFHLTGGITQWWQETGYAYFAPFTSILNANPLGFANSVFSGIFTMLDVEFMKTVRYTVTEGDQLIAQFARGRAGQAVIDDYDIDVDSGRADGGIVVAQQTLTVGKQQSLADLYQYLNLALKAGFGTGLSGSDPLILDLDGDGIELVRRDAADIYFDVDNDGFAERTSWTRNGDDDDQGTARRALGHRDDARRPGLWPGGDSRGVHTGRARPAKLTTNMRPLTLRSAA